MRFCQQVQAFFGGAVRIFVLVVLCLGEAGGISNLAAALRLAVNPAVLLLLCRVPQALLNAKAFSYKSAEAIYLITDGESEAARVGGAGVHGNPALHDPKTHASAHLMESVSDPSWASLCMHEACRSKRSS